MSYQITIQPGEHKITAEAGETILDAALRHGLMLPHNCRSGICGTCEGRILSGKISYKKDCTATLSEEKQGQGQALFCQALPESDLKIEAKSVRAIGSEFEIKTLPCRVASIELLAHNVMGVSLKLPEANPLPYMPGQYIDILLKDGRHRSYSIANQKQALGLQLHIRRVEGGFFSNHVFTAMKEKDLLRIRGPLGAFIWQEASERPVILLATGTGFAPIKCLLEQAIAEGMTRPLHLYWGNREYKDFYLLGMLENWIATHENFRFTPVLSRPKDSDNWKGYIGRVPDAALADYPELSRYEVYASGSPPMVETAKQKFTEHGLNPDYYYSDAFIFAVDEDPQPEQPQQKE